MESNSGQPSPHEASATLRDAESIRTAMTNEIRLPSGFHWSIGISIAVQTAMLAVGLARDDESTLPLALGGLAIFGLVAGVQLVRFRRLNGVWINKLASHVMLGSGQGPTIIIYGLAVAAAVLSAFAGAWWLVALSSIVGGAAYALNGVRWVRAYRNDPSVAIQGSSMLWLILAVSAALAGLAVLLIGA